MPRMLDAAVEALDQPGLETVEPRLVAALDADGDAVLSADGYLLLTPANLGYMSGALKHMFDVTYPAAVGRTTGRPYGVIVHGESDTTGAISAVEMVTTDLQCRRACPAVSLIGPVDEAGLDRCGEAAAVVAATALGF